MFPKKKVIVFFMENITIVERPSKRKSEAVAPPQTEADETLDLKTQQGTVLRGEYAVPMTSLPRLWKKSWWFQKLTVCPRASGSPKVVPVPFPVYHETETHLLLPKFLGLQWCGAPERDERSSGEKEEFVFQGTLSNTKERPQQQAHDLCFKQLGETGGALLVLPCGFGKTVVSLAVAASLKRKTLVIVTSVELARQWMERIAQFLGCEVGMIQEDKYCTDKPVTVAMLQTLLRRKPDLSPFGTCIADEAHHVAARSFSQVMPLVPCRYILGLSATPNRKDGLKRVLFWTLGPLAFKAERQDSDSPNVMQCVVTEGARRVITYKNGEVGRSKMITLLTQDGSRNRFIVHMVNMVLRTNSQRKVLMLTERREQAKALVELLQAQWSCGIMLGGMKEADIEREKEAQVLLSTYHYCSEGFDLPRLDTLVLLSPRSDVEQSVGRVLRQHPDKQKPLILDFVDNFSVFEPQSEKRISYYRKLKSCIKTYQQTELLKK